MASPASVSRDVASVTADIRRDGDRALVRFAKKFDRVTLTPRAFRVPPSEISKAYKGLPAAIRGSILACATRIREFHTEEAKRALKTWSYVRKGVRLGQFIHPIDSVGIYVPGGRFSYPSTVLMTAIPARIAGVRRVVIVTPPARLSAEILAAAKIAGVDEIYRVGGPAAVAALAVGTKSIPKVDFIIGPGNAFVTEAKRQLFGEVGIDLLAGPSELAVLADDSANADMVAADMAAQAEHDPDARSFLVSLSRKLVSDVAKALPSDLKARCHLAFEPNRAKAFARVNQLAAEHVEIVLKRDTDALKKVRNGGAIFVNRWSPAVMGDYWAGPSHVLPTGRSARFASGLSVATFLKRSSMIEVSGAAYRKGWKDAHAIAEAEGLTQHARSLRSRIGGE